MLGEPTFYRLATVFDDHSTCWTMLEHVWCSIKHLIQHHPTFLLFSCWMREILFVWPVSTTCYMRACALGLQIQPLPWTPFARVSVVWKCQRARKQRRRSIKLQEHQNEKQDVGATRKLTAWSTYWKGIDACGMFFVPTTTWKTRENEHILRSKRNSISPWVILGIKLLD